MSFISKDIDIEKSLKHSPPKYPVGVIFKKRIRVKRDLCTWPKTQEFRVHGKDLDNVSELEESYIANGFLYDEPVQVVEVDPENKDRLKGIAGYHRDGAQSRLAWDYIIYDVVEFATPRIRVQFGYTSNHHRPAQSTTKYDIIKGITRAIDSEALPDDEKSIKSFIDIIANDRSQKAKDGIYKTYRKNNCAFENLESFGGKAANEKGDDLNIPHEGTKNFERTGEYGYIKEPGGFKTVMHDGLKLWLADDMDISITGYITNPDPATLYKRRKHDKEDVNKLNSFLYQIAAKLTGMPLHEIESKGKAPFKYRGFLPQVISADPKQGGLPVENKIVDWDGKVIDRS